MKFNIKISILLIFAFWSKITFAQKYEVYEQNGKKGIKQDEKVVLNADFDDILEKEIRKNFATVQKNGKWGVYFFGKEAKWLLPAKFDEISDQYYHYRIAFGPGYDYILDRDYTILDSVLRLEFITQKTEYKEALYNDEGIETGEFNISYFYEPIKEKFLLTGKISKDTELFAIYSLEEKKIISPWTEDRIITLEQTDFSFEDKEKGYIRSEIIIYGNGQKQGVYIKNISQGSEIENELVKNFKSNLILKRSDSNYFLYNITNEGLELISDKYIFHPENYFLTFSYDVNKIGYLDEQGVQETSFDSIFINRHSTSYFTTFFAGKYGLIDPANSLTIIPNSIEELYPSDTIFNSFVVKTEKNKLLYADFNSQTLFKCSRNNVYPKKVGKYFYLFGKTNGEIGQYNEEIKQIERPFLRLELVSSYYNYFLAMGTNKKVGIINFKGDTIIPFLYDDIDLMNYDGDVFHYISVTINNKKHLFRWYDKKMVDTPFPNIKPISFAHEQSLLFEVGDPHELGLFDLFDSSFIFEMKYDAIKSMYSIKNYGSFLIAKKDSKYEVYFVGNQYKDTSYKLKNSKLYDFVFNDFGYIRVGDKFEEYDLYTHELIRTVSENEIYWEVKGISIFYEKGKFGVKNTENEIIFPAIYENLRFSTHYQNDKISGQINGKSVELNTETQEEIFR